MRAPKSKSRAGRLANAIEPRKNKTIEGVGTSEGSRAPEYPGDHKEYAYLQGTSAGAEWEYEDDEDPEGEGASAVPAVGKARVMMKRLRKMV